VDGGRAYGGQDSAMKILVVGGGGREHALCWKLASSPEVDEVHCTPGNPGIAEVATTHGFAASDHANVVRLAEKHAVDLVVIGPEDPLVGGLGDVLREKGFRVFGPGAAGARLEGSKVWAKEFLNRYRIPTAQSRRFDRSGAAKSHLDSTQTWPQVIKADGLAAGKGVFVVGDAREGRAVIDALMEERKLGDAGAEIIVEEFLAGEEVSVLAITDGRAICVLEPVMDHKQVGEGDTGPNTGGMGVVSPLETLSSRVLRQIEQHVLLPTLDGLRREEIDFRGVLFVGLMLTEAGPRVLEYNCRFGDPEVQAVVRRMKSDLVPYLVATAEGELAGLAGPEWDARTCVGVVAAAGGYPGSYAKGDVIEGLAAAAALPDVVVFHAGTASDGEHVVTAGGRVLCVTALGDGWARARERAYEAYDAIQWSGKFCRRDIGARAPAGEPSAGGLARG